MKKGNVFDADKTELLINVLERFNTKYRRTHVGWQQVKCINETAHAHGDSNPSASANLPLGYFTCHACGLKGDGFSLMLELEGMKAKEVLELFKQGSKKEESWLV